MTDQTSDTLARLYAQASAAQTPTAPVALSAVIMQAAAQAAVVQNTAPTQATVQTARPAQKRWTAGVAQLATLLNQAASAVQNIFNIPTIRYGLPAVMVAAVGFKIALPEMPSQQEQARSTAAGAPASTPTTIAASGAVSTTEKSTAKSAAPSGLTTPATAKRSAAMPAAVSNLPDEIGKDAVVGSNKNSGVADAMGKPLNSPAPTGFGQESAAPHPFPTQLTTVAIKPAGELSHADALPVPAKPVAEPAPAVAPSAVAAPAPSPVLSPASAAPPMMAARASSELSSVISKEMRLRWLIASSRMVDGVPTETCNPQAPDLERVKSWISASANPHYRPANIPNAPSTTALALRCGFSEAAAVMQLFPMP